MRKRLKEVKIGKKTVKKTKKMRKLIKKTLNFEEKEGIISISLYMDASDIVELNVVTPSLNSIYFKERHSMSNENNGQASPQEVKQKGERNGKEMYNIEMLANYVVQLFFRCEEKYNCTNTKIEKILAISALAFMKNDETLFEEAIVKKNCGLGVAYLPLKFQGVIIDGGLEGEKKSLNYSCLKNELPEIPRYINDEENILDSKVKALLTKVFLQFGAYKSSDIGALLDSFKSEISIVNKLYSEPIVDSDKVRAFFSDKHIINMYKNNEVFEFILNYENEN